MQEIRQDGTKGPLEPLDVPKMLNRLEDPKVKEFIVTKKKELQESIEDLDLKIEEIEDSGMKKNFQDARKELESSIQKLEKELDDLGKPKKPKKKNWSGASKNLKYENSLKKRRVKNKMAKKSRKKNR